MSKKTKEGEIAVNIFLSLAFLFFVGSTFGWVLEVFFRRFFSSNNPERKWIDPGFCVGPYLPLYGSGLCALYLIATLEGRLLPSDAVWSKILLLVMMAVGMTVIEYIAGLLSLKVAKVRLWDYSREWGNIQGIICPKFSLAWAALGAVYYFFVHPHILGALDWLSRNLAFSFFIGLFFGVFIIDVCYSSHIVIKLKQFAEENDVIVKYELLKASIRSAREKAAQKPRFFLPFRTDRPLTEHLKDIRDRLERQTHRTRGHDKEQK